jgi:hypothetical protein
MTMVERVARTIFPNAAGFDWDIAPSGLRDALCVTARAAIEAMREPTEAMNDAEPDGGFDIYWGYNADGRPSGPADVWRVMIEAALTESEEPSPPEPPAT